MSAFFAQSDKNRQHEQVVAAQQDVAKKKAQLDAVDEKLKPLLDLSKKKKADQDRLRTTFGDLEVSGCGNLARLHSLPPFLISFSKHVLVILGRVVVSSLKQLFGSTILSSTDVVSASVQVRSDAELKEKLKQLQFRCNHETNSLAEERMLLKQIKRLEVCCLPFHLQEWVFARTIGRQNRMRHINFGSERLEFPLFLSNLLLSIQFLSVHAGFGCLVTSICSIKWVVQSIYDVSCST